MFCYQCEQTSHGKACTTKGVCGKDSVTADLQDALYYVSQRVAQQAKALRQKNLPTIEADHFVLSALFSTVTNVNFDAERVRELILQGQSLIDTLSKQHNLVVEAHSRVFTGTTSEMASQATAHSILSRIKKNSETIAGLEELVAYGLKGTAAYAEHARLLGVEDNSVYAFFHNTLSFLTENHSVKELVTKALAVGETNLKVMEMLDRANTTRYGHPVPTQVRVTPLKGKAILVSGHDLKDLEEILKQTQDTGINVYTHGEMLPAHGYPELHKYKHLVGNYGGAWQDQLIEFEKFPGAILMTTNCIQEPRASYKHRIFTSGLVAWPGIKHIANYDFAPVIRAAQAEQGFEQDAPAKT
ncbi:MAG: hypothetical protein ACD_62C00600G0001, partial [uncultured bacterium]